MPLQKRKFAFRTSTWPAQPLQSSVDNLGSRALAFDETAAGLASMGTFQTDEKRFGLFNESAEIETKHNLDIVFTADATVGSVVKTPCMGRRYG